MNAAEARKLSQEGQKVDMTAIYKQIANRANEGYESTSINIQKWKHAASVDRVTEQLKKDGYNVKRNSGYDQRDGDSWNSLEISWSSSTSAEDCYNK